MGSLIDSLRQVVATHQPVEVPALPGRTNHIRAGVMVPLVFDASPHVVLTLRTRGIRHGGEISFPGGRRDPEDVDLEATARREAEEELGIVQADVLGRLSSMPVYTSDHRLEPFVAVVDPEMTPAPDEVAGIIRVPFEDALARDHIDAIAWDHEGLSHLSPIFVVDDLAVFGATAHTLMELLALVARVYGTRVPPLYPGRFQWEDMVRWRAEAPRAKGIAEPTVVPRS